MLKSDRPKNKNSPFTSASFYWCAKCFIWPLLKASHNALQWVLNWCTLTAIYHEAPTECPRLGTRWHKISSLHAHTWSLQDPPGVKMSSYIMFSRSLTPHLLLPVPWCGQMFNTHLWFSLHLLHQFEYGMQVLSVKAKGLTMNAFPLVIGVKDRPRLMLMFIFCTPSILTESAKRRLVIKWCIVTHHLKVPYTML